MTFEELQQVEVPFEVVSVHDKHVATVTGFSENDPLGVGGGLFPNMPTAYFEGGGWLLVNHLLKNFDIVRKQ